MADLLGRIKKLNKHQKILCSLIVLIAILLIAVFATLDNKASSLEQYIKNHPSVQQELKELNKNGVKTRVEKNTVIYTYETKEVFGDVKIDDNVKSGLQKALDGSANVKNCKLQIEKLEDKTGIKGIHITMTYVYEGQVIATKTY